MSDLLQRIQARQVKLRFERQILRDEAACLRGDLSTPFGNPRSAGEYSFIGLRETRLMEEARAVVTSGALPRRTVQEPTEESLMAMWRLLPPGGLFGGLSTPSNRSDRVMAVASRLHLTPRHVRRSLQALLAAGRIPSTWFKAGRWTPPVEEAVERLRSEAIPKHRKRHTHLMREPHLARALEVYKEIQKIDRELEQLIEQAVICEEWCKIRFQHWKSARIGGRNRVEEGTIATLVTEISSVRESSIAEIEKLSKNDGWKFLRFFVGLCRSIQLGDPRPMKTLKVQLRLSHSTFNRKYRSVATRAYKRARVTVANMKSPLGSPGNRLERTIAAPSIREAPEEIQEVFDDWKKLVNPQNQWIETHQ